MEFALVFPFLLLLVFGIIQYGWYFYVAETASGAASNVTRNLAVGDCWTGTDALDFARAQAPQTTGVDLSPENLDAAVVGETDVVVTLTADANILSLIPMPNGGIVTRTVTARLEDMEDGVCG